MLIRQLKIIYIKSLLIALLFFSVSSPSFAECWVSEVEFEHLSIYSNSCSIKIESNEILIWFRVVYKELQKIKTDGQIKFYDEQKFRVKADCVKKIATPIFGLTYNLKTKEMLEYLDGRKDPMIEMVPDSIGDYMFNIMCTIYDRR